MSQVNSIALTNIFLTILQQQSSVPSKTPLAQVTPQPARLPKAFQLLWHAGCSPPENHSLESSPTLVPLRARFLGWSDPKICEPGSDPSQEPGLRWETDQRKMSSLGNSPFGIALVISPPSSTSRPLLRAHLNPAAGADCGHQAVSRLLGPEQSDSPRIALYRAVEPKSQAPPPAGDEAGTPGPGAQSWVKTPGTAILTDRLQPGTQSTRLHR